MTGNLTFEGYFDLHSSDGTINQRCGKIDTHNAVVYLEAFRYAVNLSNSYQESFFDIGYRVKDTCDSRVLLNGIIKESCMLMYTQGIFGLVGPVNSDAALEISQILNVWGLTAVSYGASSSEFDQRHRHQNIFRTIPSDNDQRQAMLGLFFYFGLVLILQLHSVKQ